MTRQIAGRYQEPPITALEERLHSVEARVEILTEALRALAHGLDDSPLAGPGERAVAAAARQAHDMLLTIGSPPASPREAPNPSPGGKEDAGGQPGPLGRERRS